MRIERDPTTNSPATSVATGGSAVAAVLRPSRIALLAALAVSLGACSSHSGFEASLCTSAPAEEASKACEGPKRPISLTLPRAELLQRVPTGPDDITGSTGGEVPSATLAQGKPEEPAAPETPAPTPITPPATPAAAPTEAPKAEKAAEPATPAPEARSGPEKPVEAKGKDAREDLIRAVQKQQAKEAESPSETAEETPRAGRKAGREASESAISRPDASERRNGRPAGGTITLPEAVRRALGDHPLIGLATARVQEAEATKGLSESALYPQVEGRLGVGPGATGTYQTSTKYGYFSDDNAYGAMRGELSLAGRQLLYDFGATRADIERTSALQRSETLKVREQTEDITNKVMDVYLKLLEQRELLSAATENVAALEKISRLVEENEKAGNATVADLKRVRSRLVDSQTAASDAKSELQTGSDRFLRLVRQAPGALLPAPTLSRLIPSTPEPAIRAVLKGNPRILALDETLKAARHESESQKANAFPKLSFETDIGVKEYRTRIDKTELDAKGMLVFKYKFMDGGAQSRQVEQVTARVLQTEMRLRNELDDIEAEIRKHYRILAAARSKADSLRENVATAKKARELYDEQFRGGKRTLLELLDIQTAYYTARRTLINNRYEEQRSVNAVLLAMGRLTDAMLGGRR